MDVVDITDQQTHHFEVSKTRRRRSHLSYNNDTSQQNVLVIITGGTICMTYEGIHSSLRPSTLRHRLKDLVDFSGAALPHFDIIEWEELIDSSDINLGAWNKIVEGIKNNYCNYDGFVVLHGTDTLAYTASALSFMLENLNKPVVVTGAMLPMHHVQTDARKNFSVALKIAAYSGITEVCVLFGSRLLRGNRASKLDCFNMDAFDSPNFSPLGKVGVDITIDEQLLLIPSKRAFRIFPNLCLNIVVVTLTPEFQPSLLRHLFTSPTRPLGVILMLYGSGTAPTKNSELITTLRSGIQSGVEIVSVSQCVKGSCSLLTYENGALLYHIGIIEGKDMTVEAAFAKLAYLMGKGYSGDKLRYLMETDIRGEVTERPVKVTGQASLSSIIPASIGIPEISHSSPQQPSQHHLRCRTIDYTSKAESAAALPEFFANTDSSSGANPPALSNDTMSAIKKFPDYIEPKSHPTSPAPSTAASHSQTLRSLVAGMEEHAEEFSKLIAEIREHALNIHTETDEDIHSKNKDMQQRAARLHLVPATIYKIRDASDH